MDQLLQQVLQVITQRHAEASSTGVTPSSEAIAAADNFVSLHGHLDQHGLGTSATLAALLEKVAPALIGGQAGPRYFGFVTGGVTDAALLADLLVSSFDQNVQVHLPHVSIATTLEVAALDMAADLMHIDSRTIFTGKTLTTGATASNVLGLATGREAVGLSVMGPDFSVADYGFAGFKVIVLHASGHASIAKAAAIVGIGRKNCVDLADEPNSPHFDIARLESLLRKSKDEKTGVIIVISSGEVNSGAQTRNVPEIRALADTYDAWIHMDAAFGAFAPSTESHNLHLADSITSDAHKWLNVPYDCGLFYTKRRDLLFQSVAPMFDVKGQGPAYLQSNSTRDGEQQQQLQQLGQDIMSPLMVGIENSRRFRALPLYASLLALGRDGYEQIFEANVFFANKVAAWMEASPDYILLNGNMERGSDELVSSIVLFCASDSNSGGFNTKTDGNERLLQSLNDSREMYVTGTKWAGKGAIRLAVSNWRTGAGEKDAEGEETDFATVIRVLQRVMNTE
ncbi:pyridoxal phosphate-dependent transferase [Chytriomyces cf. hyalinus JEL632]|nr:pyridoxal phosphate-dependent transferase [Chytriomyces cf. hyalinus JEL632]